MRKVLQSLIEEGTYSDVVEFNNHQYKFAVLNSGENVEVMNVTGKMDALTRINAIKIETLARSLKEIDGMKLNDLDEKLEFFRSMQIADVNALYEEYNKIFQKQVDESKNIEDIKN